jgi:hypothetical protein
VNDHQLSPDSKQTRTRKSGKVLSVVQLRAENGDGRRVGQEVFGEEPRTLLFFSPSGMLEENPAHGVGLQGSFSKICFSVFHNVC